jgi:hypothetical protein
MKQQIVGYYQCDNNNGVFTVDDNEKLIILGDPDKFPPQKKMKVLPITFNRVLRLLVTKKAPLCFDRDAFEIYTKEFYKMCVAMICNNSTELEQLDDETFISVNFDFIDITTDYQLN